MKKTILLCYRMVVGSFNVLQFKPFAIYSSFGFIL